MKQWQGEKKRKIKLKAVGKPVATPRKKNAQKFQKRPIDLSERGRGVWKKSLKEEGKERVRHDSEKKVKDEEKQGPPNAGEWKKKMAAQRTKTHLGNSIAYRNCCAKQAKTLGKKGGTRGGKKKKLKVKTRGVQRVPKPK